ncbi:hypothetical protein ACFY5C_23435 [Streptomyces sp. NPDC012935]|uniref:hypothetical protein n=1 Tax=Streptomyces sp. NPDC012935 TaxID=3364857 RepID=UPI0036C13D65
MMCSSVGPEGGGGDHGSDSGGFGTLGFGTLGFGTLMYAKRPGTPNSPHNRSFAGISGHNELL